MDQNLDTLLSIATRLVELCGKGEYETALTELYADSAKQIEAYPMGEDTMPQIIEGKQALLEASRKWEASNEVHGGDIKGPFPHGSDRFAVWMSIDVTPKDGPMAGNRMKMEEVCLYTVAEGKITQVEFFWNPQAANVG